MLSPQEGRLRFFRRINDRPRRRFRRGVYLLPSLLTMGNMFCGYACVVYAMRGEFETAADHRAVQRRDDRRAAELDRLEGAMPHARVRDAAYRIVLLQFGKIEPGAKVLTCAVHHNRPHALGNRRKKRAEAAHGGVVQRVALRGTIETKDRDVPVNFQMQRLG